MPKLPSSLVTLGIPTSAVILSVALTASPVNGQLTFLDTEFENSDWNRVVVAKDGGTVSGSASQAQDGGTPGAYRLGRLNFSRGSFFDGHRLLAATHDPSADGAVSSLTCEMDVRSIDGDSNCGGGAGDPLTSFGFMIRQGEAHYTTEIQHVSKSQNWHTLANGGLDEESFSLIITDGEESGTVDSESHPDFSEFGGNA